MLKYKTLEHVCMPRLYLINLSVCVQVIQIFCSRLADGLIQSNLHLGTAVMPTLRAGKVKCLSQGHKDN